MIRELKHAATMMLVAGLVVMTAGAVEAVPITGDITLGGRWVPVDENGNQTTIADATGVNITNDQASVDCAVLKICQGDYATLQGAIVAFHSDFQFQPFADDITPLWSFTYAGKTYSFDLLNISSVTQDGGLVLQGEGNLFITGFTPTAARWSFSGDTPDQGVFSFSSTAVAQSVPDGGSVTMLLGMALMGLAGVRRMIT